MAHLQYSEKDKGFYVSTRRNLNLGWTFLDDNGNVIGEIQRLDLTSYERVLINWRERDLISLRRPRRRLNLKKGKKRNGQKK